ncbi:MAG: DMT family transporter [Galactobacter sp.]|uniref:DMT family transporter n=1 Tax=Galactobacter sp. TaxID=2676125 RepID=UPI0025BE50FF|nr:EamA family transporter [Galactobacter sp.]
MTPPSRSGPDAHPGRTSGILAITTTAALWGTTGTAATFAPEAGPLAIGSAALGVGGLLQAVVAIRPLWRQRSLVANHAWLLLIGALAVVGYPLAFYSSMHLAGVAVGTAVSLASAPLFSGVTEWVVDRRAPSRTWCVAAGLGVIGTGLTSAAHGGGHGSATVWGVLLGLAAGLTYAVYSWVVQRMLAQGVGRAAAMGAVFGLGGLGLMPVLLVTGAPLVAGPSAFTVAAYMSLVPMFAGYLFFGYGLTRVPASTATTITLLEPAVAALLAVVVVGERLGWLGWLGLVVLGCSLVVLISPLRRRPDPPLTPS